MGVQAMVISTMCAQKMVILTMGVAQVFPLFAGPAGCFSASCACSDAPGEAGCCSASAFKEHQEPAARTDIRAAPPCSCPACPSSKLNLTVKVGVKVWYSRRTA